MTTFTAAELTAMRTVVQSTFESTAIVRRVTRVSDGMGGGTAAYVAAGTVLCHLGPSMIRPEERVPSGAPLVMSLEQYTVRTLDTADVRVTDQLEIRSRFYEVTGERNERTWQLERRFDVVKVL